MTNIASAKKRARQSEKRRRHNASFRSLFRTQVKKVITAIASGNKESAANAYQSALPIIDRMVNKGLIHRNKAARHKSRMTAKIRALG